MLVVIMLINRFHSIFNTGLKKIYACLLAIIIA